MLRRTLTLRFRLIIKSLLRVTAFVSLLALATIGSTRFTLPFSDWKRISAEPIVQPQGDGFQSAGTFNPAVVKKDGKFVMLYRAQDGNGTSRLGYATSTD